MSLPADPSNNQPFLSGFGVKAMTVGAEVGCLTLVIILGAVFGGLWLDKIFETKPIITIVLVLGSIPISLGLTFLVAIRSVRGINPSKISTSKNRGNDHPTSHEGDLD